jgi:NAD(P)H-dependent flavin oxidoreductase YrpB (nitropropane dioxygenase family)
MLPSINAPDYLGYARVAVEEGIKVVETAGNPDPVLPFLKANNVIVIHKCVSIGHALKAEAKGVDCISIDGWVPPLCICSRTITNRQSASNGKLEIKFTNPS